jgi:YD repeat-containing protein
VGRAAFVHQSGRADLAKATDAAGQRTTYTYDNLGRTLTTTVTSDSFPSGLTTTYTYTPQGQQQAITNLLPFAPSPAL